MTWLIVGIWLLVLAAVVGAVGVALLRVSIEIGTGGGNFHDEPCENFVPHRHFGFVTVYRFVE